MMIETKRKNNGYCLSWLGPYTVWAVLFIIIPMGFVAFYAFTNNEFHFTYDNILRIFTTISSIENQAGLSVEVRTYILILERSVKLAVISTIVCLLIGYPLALIIAGAGKKIQKTMITLLMIPMWMNFLIRTYAWMTILQDSGVINSFIVKLGMRPFHIIGTQTAVIIGMVYDYLPYMVLPVYSVVIKTDENLIEAAKDLGCNNVKVFKNVIFPLSIPGILSGITMVLIPSVSTFYISQKLGNGKFFLIGDAIEGQYIANNLHFAAAMALVLMLILMLLMGILKYLTGKTIYGGVVN